MCIFEYVKWKGFLGYKEYGYCIENEFINENLNVFLFYVMVLFYD